MKDEITDKQLKELLKKELPQAPENPWFVCKVINRLPERRSALGNIIEYAGFALAAILLACFWLRLFNQIDTANAITFNDLIYCIIMIAMTISLVMGFVLAQLRKI